MDKYYGLIAMVILLIVLVIFIKYQVNKEDEVEEEEVETKEVKATRTPLDLNDEDAVVASLIASIECLNATKKNVQVISVRKVG